MAIRAGADFGADAVDCRCPHGDLDSIRQHVALIERGPISHVVTLIADGSSHVSLAWVSVEDDEIVIGAIPDQAKLRNIRRDPRVERASATGETGSREGLGRPFAERVGRLDRVRRVTWVEA